MNLPKLIGKVVYVGGYPVIYNSLKGTNRVYGVITFGDKLLLTKNWLGLHRDWRLPGGGVSDTEEPEQALLREIAEEVGMKIKRSQLNPLSERISISKHGFYYRLYRITLDQQPALKIRCREIAEARFINFKELDSLPLSEIAVSAKELLNLA